MKDLGEVEVCGVPLLIVLACLLLFLALLGCGTSSHVTRFSERSYADGKLTHEIEQATEVKIGNMEGKDLTALSAEAVQDASGGYSIYTGQKKDADLVAAPVDTNLVTAVATAIIAALKALGMVQ